jgi:hypothetical protein
MRANHEIVAKIGTVINNIDPYGGGRVQIRLSDDDTLNDPDIPWAFPGIPKHFHILPKIGEACWVITPETSNFGKISERLYFGPIISQLDRLDYEIDMTAESFYDEALVYPALNPQWDENSVGVYPYSEHSESIRSGEIGEIIGLLGRQNNDVLLKDNELWLRVGKYNVSNNRKVFSSHPGFIKMKNYKDVSPVYNRVDETGNTDFSSSYKTVSTVVSDEILLISSSPNAKGEDKYMNHGGKYPVNNPREMVDDETIKDILETAHRLPYGDVLVDFLDKFRSAFLNHEHNIVLVPPVRNKEIENIAAYDLEEMLTNNIKIN